MPDNTRSSGLGSAGQAKAPASVPAPQKRIFHKEGEHWTVGLGAKTVRLKDSKGLVYLSYLLRHPAMEFHVLDRPEESPAAAMEMKAILQQPIRCGVLTSSKNPEFISADSETPVRCWTIKPKAPIGAGLPSCAKNWKKLRRLEK